MNQHMILFRLHYICWNMNCVKRDYGVEIKWCAVGCICMLRVEIRHMVKDKRKLQIRQCTSNPRPSRLISFARKKICEYDGEDSK